MNGGKRGPPTGPPKHLNEFTKALASEVRMLLEDVGQLRDERRQLQYEIAELMALKSKHGAGGEYTPDWMPKPGPEALPAPPPQPSIEDAPREPAPPAWRTIVRHEPRQRKSKMKSPPPAQAQLTAPPGPVPIPPAPQVPAWAQWKPNPLLTPQPRMGTASAPLPSPAPAPKDVGLFGPSTPPPK